MSETRPWLKNYSKGVPANIDPDAYPNLITLFDEIFKKYANKVAFHSMGKDLTFKELDTKTRNFAAYLHSRGLDPGDKIALMMPNMLQYPIALIGCMRAGLVVVNTNPLYTPREMKHQFTDSGAKAIIIAENFAANLESILPETSIKTIIVTSIGEMLGMMKGTIVNFVVRKVKGLVPKYNLPNTVNFTKAVAEGVNFQIKPFKTSGDDVISLQYTGGTTGVSKGAMLTNKNLISNMQQIRAIMLPVMREGGEVALCALPLYHIFAFTVNCLALMSVGSKNILITNARDIPSVVKEFKKHKISLVTGVNTLFNALSNNADFANGNFSDLHITCGGGTAVQRAVAERWQQITGCPISEGYGMTESSPVISSNPVLAEGIQLGTIGMPAPSTDVRIVDEQGNVLGYGEAGEIQAKGPQIMKGYYNRPDATAETIKDGWLCTGDVGIMNPDGYLKIVDRIKDMILVSGFNVYPNEIEDVLAMHPKVMESAAVGVKDDHSGEAVKVFIVKKDDSLTEQEIIAHCKTNLTAYKVPRKVEFRTELPKTNVGKILRRELRDA